MNGMKTACQLMILGMVLLWFHFPVFAGEDVQFSWAVLADTPDGQRPLDFTKPEPLVDGTTLQIFLEQQPGVYLYVYLVDSSGELALIFPEGIDYYNETSPDDRIIRIPPGASRFEFTPPPGQEKLYLMASNDRLVKLEQLTAEYLENQADRRGRMAVMQEMKRIRRQHSKLSQVTETSVPVAGTVRSSVEMAETFNVTQVKANTFYSRILRISHE